MKKILRRINRGAVLFLVLLLGMLIYFIIQSGIDKKTHAELRDIATDFIADTANQVIIPETLRVSSEAGMVDISDLVTSYNSSRTGSWSRFYSDTIQVRQFASGWLGAALAVQADTNTFILASELRIDQFNRFYVYRDRATLSFSVTDTRTILKQSGEEVVSVKSYAEKLDFIREDGRWVILQYSSERLMSALMEYSQG